MFCERERDVRLMLDWRIEAAEAVVAWCLARGRALKFQDSNTTRNPSACTVTILHVLYMCLSQLTSLANVM